MEFTDWAKKNKIRLTRLTLHERMDLVELFWQDQDVKKQIKEKRELHGTDRTSKRNQRASKSR